MTVSKASQAEKGRKGERDVAKLVGGLRTPLSGSAGGSDISLPSDSHWNDWAIEVKRRARIGGVGVKQALEQAKATIGYGSTKNPLVFMREDHGPWMVVAYADDFISWANALNELGQGSKVKTILKQARQRIQEAIEIL